MKKIFLALLLATLTLFAYDFGTIPEKKFNEMKIDKPLMVMVGKTHCIWCESMAPALKEITEEYPETNIYYVNTDHDVLGAINNNIVELPVQIFYDAEGKEVFRNLGYINKEKILEYLEEYNVLDKATPKEEISK